MIPSTGKTSGMLSDSVTKFSPQQLLPPAFVIPVQLQSPGLASELHVMLSSTIE